MSSQGDITQYEGYTTLKVEFLSDWVLNVMLNRPDRLNTFSPNMWSEIHDVFSKASDDSFVRVVVVTAAEVSTRNGTIWTAGLDLRGMAAGTKGRSQPSDHARKMRPGYKMLKNWQRSLTSIAECEKPVIAAVSGGCFGGGVDLISACDMRLCSADAYFCIKEVDIGIPADVGTLQRLPRLIGNKSLCRELAFTGRHLPADEAKEFGLVSRVLPDRAATVQHAMSIAQMIAEKSPVAIVGIKEILNYAEDHTVADGLNYVNVWNHGMGQSNDTQIAITSNLKKTKPKFSKL